MPGLETVTTERLRGERLGPQHVDPLLAIFGDPRVGATMGGVWSRAKTEEVVAGVDRHWDEHGFGYMLWFERATGAPTGWGGLSRSEFDGERVLEVGWTTAPEHWGKGYATELGRAMIDVAFGPLGARDVVAYTLPHNAASRRVMEKLGFAYERTAPYKTYGEHVLYRLMRS
jgi:RimJ/RimL family protein N-acetyltransferase